MKKNKKAFTLIELLVVVLIIGILAAVALPQYQKSVAKSRFTEAFVILKAMAQAAQLCELENSSCGNEEKSIETPEETTNFTYATWYNEGEIDYFAAQYKKEEVCLCLLKSGEFIITQYEEVECNAERGASFDYAKLLNVKEDSSSCACC